MGKLQLKKELATMTREQMVQVVMDAYSARKEIREYFDFFLDPDVDKLREKTLGRIDRELMRAKHGHSTARITQIRREIKNFAGYAPGAEHVRDIMMETLRHILVREKYVYYKEAFEKGTRKLIDDIVQYADAHALMDSTMAQLSEISRDPAMGTASFRTRMLSRFMYLK